AEIELFTTTNGSGTGAINLTGNEFDQTIIGNAGDNIVDGKAGADTMRGLGGNDTYIVDNAGDTVNEFGVTGIDKVKSSITFSLGDTAHVRGDVENLTLTGTADIDGTGNALDNILIGNIGDN